MEETQKVSQGYGLLAMVVGGGNDETVATLGQGVLEKNRSHDHLPEKKVFGRKRRGTVVEGKPKTYGHRRSKSAPLTGQIVSKGAGNPSPVDNSNNETAMDEVRRALRHPAVIEVLSDHLGCLQGGTSEGEPLFMDETQSLFMLQFIGEVDRAGETLTKRKALEIFREFLGFVDEWSTGEVSPRGFYSFAYYQSQNDVEFAERFRTAVVKLRSAIDTCGGTLSCDLFEPVVLHLLGYLDKRYFGEEAFPKLKVSEKALAKALLAAGELKKVKGSKLKKQEIERRDAEFLTKLTKLEVREGKILSPRKTECPEFDQARLVGEITRLADTSLCCPPGWAAEKPCDEWHPNKGRQLVERALASSPPLVHARKLLCAWKKALAEYRSQVGNVSLLASSLDRSLADLECALLTGQVFSEGMDTSVQRVYEGLVAVNIQNEEAIAAERAIAQALEEGFWGKIADLPDTIELLQEADLALQRMGVLDEERNRLVEEIGEQPPYVCEAADQQGKLEIIKRDRTRQFQKEGVLVFRGSVKVNGEELGGYKKTPSGFLLAMSDALQKQWPQKMPVCEEKEFGEGHLPEAYLKLITGTSISAYQLALGELKKLWGSELRLERVKDIGADYELVATGENLAARTTYWYRVQIQDPNSDLFCEVARFQIESELTFDQSVDLQEIRLRVKHVEFQGVGGWALQQQIAKALQTITVSKS